jgi:hypothetical protein
LIVLNPEKGDGRTDVDVALDLFLAHFDWTGGCLESVMLWFQQQL